MKSEPENKFSLKVKKSRAEAQLAEKLNFCIPLYFLYEIIQHFKNWNWSKVILILNLNNSCSFESIDNKGVRATFVL